MSWLRLPLNRWALAGGALCALGAPWLLSRLSLVTLARVTLALCVAGVLWALSSRRRGGAPPPPPRLLVTARLALTAKCNLALIEVDELPYLVTFGEGFAQVTPTQGSGAARVAREGRLGLDAPGPEGWAQ